MKYIYGVLFLILCTGSSFAQNIIFGKVQSADGIAIPKAIAFLQMGTTGKSIDSCEVDENGNFNFKTKLSREFTITVAAVNHQSSRMKVWIDENVTPVEVSFSLEANTFTESDKGFSVVTDIDKFDFEAAKKLNKQANGTYTLEIATKSPTLKYQVLTGDDDEAHSVNGSMSDAYEYDGAGDYRSIIKAQNGKATIVFTPSAFPAKSAGAKNEIKNGVVKAMYDILADANKERHKIFSEYRKVKAKDENATFEYDAQEVLKTWAQKVKDEKSIALKRAYSMGYTLVAQGAATSAQNGKHIDTLLIRGMYTIIPSTSPMWGLNTSLIYVGSAFMKGADSLRLSAYLDEAFTKNEDTSVSQMALVDFVRSNHWQKNYKASEAYYAKLKKLWGKSEVMEYVQSMNPDRAVQVGRKAPKFAIKDISNASVTYSNESLKGKFVLIDFWATWCGPCMMEMPKLHEAYEKFKSNPNFEVLSISYDGSAKDVAKLREKGKFPMPWKHAFAEGGFKSDIGKAFEVSGIPRPVLLGPDGTILAVETELRGNDLEKTLAKHLK